ncbi:MAG: helix-turn-helix transcriptional regulator [Ilumatobacteraceae bacterium]
MTPAAATTLARRRAGVSRRRPAELASTSPATIIAYENGRVQPSLPVLERILAAAGQALVVEVRPRPAIDEGTRGDELVSALRLAAGFPARHPPRWRAPIFPAR